MFHEFHAATRQAGVARAAMMHQAARHRIAWSFQVAQGRTNEAVLLAAAAGDIIAMARRFGPLGQASGFGRRVRSEEHTSELQSLMRISYAVFCLKKKKITIQRDKHTQTH